MVCQNNLEDFRTYLLNSKYYDKLSEKFPFNLQNHKIFQQLDHSITSNAIEIEQIHDISSLVAYLRREDFIRYLLKDVIETKNHHLLHTYLSNNFMKNYINIILNEVNNPLLPLLLPPLSVLLLLHLLLFL